MIKRRDYHLLLYIFLQLEATYNIIAVAKWLERQTADVGVPGSSPHHGMEELSRSSFSHCFTPPRCNGYLALGNLSDGAS